MRGYFYRAEIDYLCSVVIGPISIKLICAGRELE